MVGLNLLMVGAVAEAHLGDAPANAAPPSEGIDFAGVLEAILPTDELPAPEVSASPDAPNADALQAQMVTLGLMTLPTTPTPEPATQAIHPTPAPEPLLRTDGAEGAQRLQAFTPRLLEPTEIQEPTPAFDRASALGDGMGDADLTQKPDSENLLTVEGDAPPVPARQAEPPPPPSSTSTPIEAAYPEGATLNTQAEATPPEGIAASPTQPYSGDSPTPTAHEPRLPRDEQPAGQQEPRTLTATHTTAPAQHTPHALSATESASPRHHAEPNWGAAEQVAQHIERMVYERERNRLTVRLDPPELGAVEVRIQATGGEVQAWLTAERDLTRQMLQQAQQYLREQLESRGLHLTHFDVGAQSQFQHAPREQHTHYEAHATPTRTPTATDSLLHDGRWSVWV
jgi:hypothetical protein